MLRPFKYTPAAATNIRKTLAKELRRLAEERRKQEALEEAAKAKVHTIKKGTK